MASAPIQELAIDGVGTGLRIRVADRWWTRAVGLLATPSLEDPCGLWLAPCSSVHMVGMRYAIDVAFIGRDGRVARVVHGLKPWRFAACRGARATLELRAGLAGALRLAPGQQLARVPVHSP